jgi:uncharacterized protein (TIGR02268 family)
MLQPVTPARALVLLLAVTAAEAQPARGRGVTVAVCPGAPLPEVRVAAGYTTALVLDAPVDKDSVQLDTPPGDPRIRVLAVGEHTVVFETLVTPGREERWVLRVRYAGVARPEWAAFALVAHPGGAVDMRVDAVRPRQPPEGCQEQGAVAQAPCHGARAEVWALADSLGGKPVQVKEVRGTTAVGTAYRLGGGLLLVLKPLKEKAGPPWTPTAAVLRSDTTPGEEVPVHAVHVREGPPGEWGEMAVEAALPPPAAGVRFTVVLRGEEGQALWVERVEVPPTPKQPEEKEGGR